jgi:hypothetical protein
MRPAVARMLPDAEGVLRHWTSYVYDRTLGRARQGLQLIDYRLSIIAVWVARLYQRKWQPATGCLYDPVCSDYSIEAFKTHGGSKTPAMQHRRKERIL